MAELCVDWSSRFLPGSLSTLALLGGGCNFQLLWIAKLWWRASLFSHLLSHQDLEDYLTGHIFWFSP
ncbi:hypothetical protein Peur_021131 [Populus x canadensis]